MATMSNYKPAAVFTIKVSVPTETTFFKEQSLSTFYDESIQHFFCFVKVSRKNSLKIFTAFKIYTYINTKKPLLFLVLTANAYLY